MATRIEEILLRVRTELGDAQAEVAGLAALLQALEGKQTGVDVDAHVAKALTDVAAVDKALDVLDKRSVDVDVSVDSKAVRKEFKQLELLFETLDGKKVQVDATLEAKQAIKEAEQLELLLGSIDGEDVQARIRLDAAQAQREAEALEANLRRIEAMHAETDVDVNTAEANLNLAQLEMKFATLDGQTVDIDVTLDGGQAIAEAEQLQFILENLDHEAATPRVTLDEQIAQDIAEIEAALEAIGRENIDINLDVSSALAEAELLNRELDAVLTDRHVGVDLDTSNALIQAYALNQALDEVLDADNGRGGGAGGALRQVSDGLDGASNSARGATVSIGNFSFRLGAATGPVLILAGLLIGSLVAALAALVASAGAAVAALGALAVALGAVLGPAIVFVAAVAQRLGKIFEAKKAQDAAQTAAAKESAGAARDAAAADDARRSAANAVRDALEDLTTAERAYKEAVKQARKDIESAVESEREAHKRTIEAQRDVGLAVQATADARQDAADAIATAARRVSDAELANSRVVRDAARTMANAYERVSEARKRAEKELVNANKAVAQSFRDVRDASLDARFAQIDLADAEDRVEDIQKRISDLLEGSGFSGTESLSRLQDVQLQGLDIETMFPGIGQEADKAEELTDLLRDLERAKLNVEKATNDLSDSELDLADAQATNAKYVQEGVNAYEPYQAALAGVATAQENVALAAERTGEQVSDSQVRLNDARAALEALQKAGVEGSDRVIAALERERDARMRLTSAREAEDKAEKKLAELRKQGIKNAPNVISAQERLRDAHQALEEALYRQSRAGQSAAGAAGGMSAADFKAAQAAGELSAAELKLLGVIRQVISAFRDMTKGGVDIFLDSLATALTILLPLFSKLQPAFTELGKAFGAVAITLAKELVKPENVKFFQDMIKASADLIKILGTDVFINLYRVLRNIATAAMPFLISGAEAFGKLLEGWAKSTGDTTKLGKTIGFLVEALDAWVDLAGSLVELFWVFIKDAAPVGNKLVRWIAGVAKHLAKWMDSAEGSRIIKEFFEDSLPLIKEFARLFGALFIIFLQVFGQAAKLAAPLLRIINDLLFFLIRLYQAFKDLTRPMFDFISLLLNGVASALGWVEDKAGKLIKALDISKVLNDSISSAKDFGKDLMNGIANGIASVVTGVIDAITDWWSKVLKFFGVASPAKKGKELGEAIAEGIITGIVATATALVKIGGWILEQIQKGIQAAGSKLSDAAGWVKNRVVEFVQRRINDFKSVGSWITNRIADGIQAVTSYLTTAAGWLKNRVVEYIQARITDFKSVGSWVTNRIAEGIQLVTASLSTAAGWVKNRVKEFVEDRINDFKSVGSWITNRIADGIEAVTSGISGAAGWLKNRVKEFVEDRINDFKSVGSWILGTLIDGMTNAPAKVWNELKGFVDKIVKKVKDFLGIKSPSRVFMGIGEQMAAGLFKGFGAGDVVGFIGKHFGGLAKLAPQLVLSGLINIADLPVEALEKLGGIAGGLWNKLFGGEGDNHPIPEGSSKGGLALAERMARAMGISLTSAFRPGDPGYHGKNRARDFSNVAGHKPPLSPKLMELFYKFIATFGRAIRELIYSYASFNIKNGARVPRYAIDDHWNHVHLALARGGVTKGPTLAEIGEGRYQEAVLPLSRAMFAKLAEGIVAQLHIASPRFPMPGISSSPYSAPPAAAGGGVSIGQVVLPPAAADQNGFDGRHGAALLMQELRARGAVV